MIPVIIFAKVPLPGFAKTRIAAASDTRTADRIYRELLASTARSISGIPHHVAFTGAASAGELPSFFPEARSFIAQCDGSLGERLQQAFTFMYRQHNAEAAIAIGCDCPYLSERHFREAAEHLLHDADVVIAPAVDGGYTLVGCRPGALPIFQARSWGQPQLLAETLEIIHVNGFKLKLLAKLPDIDTLDDYLQWYAQRHSAIYD